MPGARRAARTARTAAADRRAHLIARGRLLRASAAAAPGRARGDCTLRPSLSYRRRKSRPPHRRRARMSTIAGPVTDTMPRPVLAERLAFNNGALLDADQLRLEQHYHRSRLGRALAYLHGYGTIAGLNVVVGPLAA